MLGPTTPRNLRCTRSVGGVLTALFGWTPFLLLLLQRDLVSRTYHTTSLFKA